MVYQVLAVAVKEDLWLPFTFIRVLTMSLTVKRIVTAMDFPEIAEQLAVTGIPIHPRIRAVCLICICLRACAHPQRLCMCP